MTIRSRTTPATRTGPELRRIREAAGVSAARLGQTLGVGRPRVSVVENSIRVTADLEGRYIEAVAKTVQARTVALEEAS